ncbi:uncharacterized protein LOC103382319 isoform X2 [Cynoglossus semilaevis]|uniref:uncharacterized protein LOC103382319 isoform X2 n=1 Tax=Cynoglossus semilaevis TaxID=244447 RepID=UPI000D62840F|nr:uncharacterized protein LOC103382319 isoform X2 [Cynoglossus semilaevis]
MMAPLPELPTELWLHIFGFLSLRDKLSMRCTCLYFRNLMDKTRPLWRGFSVTLRDFSRYNRAFWRSLVQRHLGSVLLRSGKGKDLRTLSTCLPALSALRLEDWREGGVTELKKFKFSCVTSHLLAAICQLTRLSSLVLHHNGNIRVPTLSDIMSHLTGLKHLSCTMITYKNLPDDFFSPAPLTGGGTLQLTDLQLLNYDAVVTRKLLQPLSNLQSLSIFHLYSVPGPVCHMTTWLTSLPQLRSLSVHGGHPLTAYADLLPSSLLSLTLCVDLQPEDLQVASLRVPHLEHLHLEPWSSLKLVRLLPHLFPELRTLAIRHHSISDEDFLSLQQLQYLHTLEILDPFHRPDPTDPGWIVYEPSPHLQQLINDLQKLTNYRVQVITSSKRDPLSCSCV